MADRILALRLGAWLLVVVAALITVGCGTPVQPAGNNASHSLTVSGNLPAGTAAHDYNAVLNVSGGSAPYHFAVKSGSLAQGLTLNSATGSISGRPISAGSYSFEVVVTDAPLPDEGVQTFVMHVRSRDSVKVSISPTTVTVAEGHKSQFTATVSGTPNTAVTWSASAGLIDAQGLYSAPPVNSPMNVTITAASQADPSSKASASVTVENTTTPLPTIVTTSLPHGQLGSFYSETLTATGGTQPYSWSISAGTPPPGITLASDGQVLGLPGAPGTASFTVSVKDAAGLSAQHNFSLDIASGGNFDGPAELPKVTVSSAMANTPAPGNRIAVNAGGNLQAALTSASCGDTITLEAGATFNGIFKFPAKNCDNGHWIMVRTSAPDSQLPAEGQRLTPCYAGVASLPGRPQYRCDDPQNVLAKLIGPGNVSGPVILQTGANHYRLIGLELTRATGVKGAPTLISLDSGAAADHIVVDRSWLHGTTQDDAQNGIRLAGTSYVAIVDSYFSDFHCTSVTGSCTDAHAVGGGTGDHQDGPFLIENNFLEASGEAVMFGGGPATLSPADITISSNHFFKPWLWRKGSPNFRGGPSGNPFIVKNHLELKNAVRVLVEGNLMENVWGGFSQDGHAIVLGPKNQYSYQTGLNLCPVCQVTDVTVRYTHVAHAAGGMIMATANSDSPTGGAALAGARWSIHDVVFDDISRQYAGGGGLFLLLNGWPVNPLNTVTINHITGFPDPNSHILTFGNQLYNPPMYGFVFTNNLLVTGAYPVWGAGGGSTTCAYTGTPAFKIANCFATYTFANNVLIATPSGFPPSSWPAANLFPPDPTTVFVQYNDGNGGNYQLQSDSPYKNKGTDGRDPGADIVGLNAALAGVE